MENSKKNRNVKANYWLNLADLAILNLAENFKINKFSFYLRYDFLNFSC